MNEAKGKPPKPTNTSAAEQGASTRRDIGVGLAVAGAAVAAAGLVWMFSSSYEEKRMKASGGGETCK